MRRKLTVVRIWCAMLTAVIFFLPAEMQAFSSGSPLFAFGWHGRITGQALEPMGFSDNAVMHIKRGNRHQDWDIAPIRILDSKRHFCRDRDQPHQEGFMRNKAYLEAERDRMIEMLMDYDPRIRKARRVMGWCLHTVQDAFSHSNYPHMTDADKKTYIRAVTDVGVEPPPGLTLTCSGPDSRDSLSYGHDDHHKDDESSPEGSDAFQSAKEGAVLATREFVETTRKMLVDEVGDHQRAQEIWDRFIGGGESVDSDLETS